MRAAGVDTYVDISALSVMGLIEVLRQYRKLSGILKQMQNLLHTERPDLLITVDYPGFNLRLAKTAKKLGIKVMHYISPQVWAWRQGRVKKIAKRVDMMTVVLPFEAEFYERFNVPVRFVGHPMVDEAIPTMEKQQAYAAFQLNEEAPVIGLFPGSRRSEISKLLPTMLESAEQIVKARPTAQFILPLASSIDKKELSSHLSAHPQLKVVIAEGKTSDVIQICDAVITASGTATLELALFATPMVIIYKVSNTTFRIVTRMLKIPHIGLCNIVLAERVVPELLQDKANPQQITRETLRLLEEQPYRDEIIDKLRRTKERLGGGGASAKAANVALEMLN